MNIQKKLINGDDRTNFDEPLSNPFKVMIVAGEASGDEHAALLVEQLRILSPNIQIFGMGGSKLRKAGMDTVVDSEVSASVMGLVELGGKVKEIFSAFWQLVGVATDREPDVVVLLDFPDFNLRLAKVLKRKGYPVLYYIAPQVWAWRRYRVNSIRKYIDKVAAIFPFEEDFYRRHGVNATYVGHPFSTLPDVSVDRKNFLSSLGLSEQQPVVALLPGSRKSEVERLLKPMLDGVDELRRENPALQVIIPIASSLDREIIESFVDNRPNVVCVDGQAREILAVSDSAVVASGTATVEAALSGIPFLVVYRLAPFTYRIARLLIRGVKNIAMANLIAGRKVVKELIQDEVTGEKIARELNRLMTDDSYRSQVVAGLSDVKSRLREGAETDGNPSIRAAKLVLDLATRSEVNPSV